MGIQDLIGQRLGPYELCDLIGIGGMSAVYRARCKSGEVAVKVLLPALVRTHADHFDQMAKIRLEHPHIVPIVDAGIENTSPPSPLSKRRGGEVHSSLSPLSARERGFRGEGLDLHYIVMPLLTGGTLAERLQSGQNKPGPYQNVVDLLLPLASALDYAHTQGVIHGDIKPGNVLFDDGKNAYLSDFGSTGTPHFKAPEVWLGEPPTPASDQYAFGVLAYLLLTGRYPFASPSRSALKDQHLEMIPTSPRSYCPALPESADAMLRALSKLPDARFPTATAFITALEEG